ncbi:hypothetical protein ACFYUJ_00255 [Streptomyces sp. NPDC004520]|uniref:hypothetical protein n=1 Tax=Streptomyces sp. NPDC004520 TaxID=3364702 RepID=UPI00369A260C
MRRLAPWRPEIGIGPKPGDAEPVTLAVMQALLGHVSEPRWTRCARSHLRHLFPYLPGQPGCNRRLRKAADLIAQVERLPATDTSLWTDSVRAVDSAPIECGRPRKTVKRSDLAGGAEHGYRAGRCRLTLRACPGDDCGRLFLDRTGRRRRLRRRPVPRTGLYSAFATPIGQETPVPPMPQ